MLRFGYSICIKITIPKISEKLVLDLLGLCWKCFGGRGLERIPRGIDPDEIREVLINRNLEDAQNTLKPLSQLKPLKIELTIMETM